MLLAFFIRQCTVILQLYRKRAFPHGRRNFFHLGSFDARACSPSRTAVCQKILLRIKTTYLNIICFFTYYIYLIELESRAGKKLLERPVFSLFCFLADICSIKIISCFLHLPLALLCFFVFSLCARIPLCIYKI
jgi:hypothetical protein